MKWIHKEESGCGHKEYCLVENEKLKSTKCDRVHQKVKVAWVHEGESLESRHTSRKQHSDAFEELSICHCNMSIDYKIWSWNKKHEPRWRGPCIQTQKFKQNPVNKSLTEIQTISKSLIKRWWKSKLKSNDSWSSEGDIYERCLRRTTYITYQRKWILYKSVSQCFIDPFFTAYYYQ